MNSLASDSLKLSPVLDLAAAAGFLATLRQRAQSSSATRIDASAVETLTLPCIQILLAAAKDGHRIAVVDPSVAFVDAFANLALDWPHDAVDAAAPPTAAPPQSVETDVRLAHTEDTAMAKRILTIDDSKTIRDMLRMTLADAGFEVLQAVDGQEGVEVMDREVVDLVITDINMPRKNGYEVVRHLRGRPDLQKLPILVLTTESDDDKKSLARDAGATGWMVKPFDPERLLATVNKVLPPD